MASRDYYVVLGVPRGATPAEIRNAYRELAKELHPDRKGDGETAPFQELGEAYETLSDPARRRAYDDEHDRVELTRWPMGTPEPLREEPFSILHGEARRRPPWEALLQRFQRNFTGLDVPKGEVPRSLSLQVILTSEEAAHGVVVPIEVPTFAICPICGGSGHDWEFMCTYCRGQGVVEHGRPVRLRIPPAVGHGSVYEIPLDSLGVHNLYLRVEVFVDDRAAF